MGVVVLYSVPVSKLNSAIIYANKNVLSEVHDTTWITADNMKLLQIVDPEILSEEVIVNISSQKDFLSIGIGKISFVCEISVVVQDEEWNVLKKFDDYREVAFVFSNFEWKVSEIK
jgi:hypothetical protein